MLEFEGTYTALVTPFLASEAIDWRAFDALVDAQIEGGISGLVPCGTTGESPTLGDDEQLALVKRSVERARGRVPVIAGTGSNSTRHAIELSKAAEGAGASAVMVVVPYYNKPTQEGLLRHFVAVAGAVRCPVMIYNIPGRTGIDLGAETMARICEAAPNVVATKEATGNVLRAQELVRRLGDRIAVLCGDDALTLAMIAVGARGVVSVSSNLLPKAVSDATRAALAGDVARARRLHLDLVPVHEAMFLEANPGPVKAAMAARGMVSPAVRSPMVPVSEATQAKLAAALEEYARRSEA
jgi:4-hydroxy-tetrahydrodipicolinate synthase